jgi:hypothetical protein
MIGYLSQDHVSSWCSTIVLAHLIADHAQYKEALLQVTLTIDQEETRTKSLMQISIDRLENVEETNACVYRVTSIIFY